MARLRLLLPILLVLALANVAWMTYSRWGLVTVNADGRPLSEVIRSIEKQAGITLRTNLDPTLPVQMHVQRVPLTEALETLSTVTDSRWRLSYFMAPNKAEIASALGSVAAGQRPEGWKIAYLPVFGTPGAEIEDLPPDPRTDPWDVKAPAERTFQAYAEDAARHVSASFSFPETWNPAVTKTLKPGPISKLAPQLASAAGGKVEEVFLLQKSQRRGPDDEEGERPARTDRGERRSDGPPGNFNREAMEQRMEAEIAKLPTEKQAAARKEMDERRAFFTSLRDLPEAERRSKMEDFFSRPEIQERMEERDAQRDARRTPEQRVERYKKYVERKTAQKNGTAPATGK